MGYWGHSVGLPCGFLNHFHPLEPPWPPPSADLHFKTGSSLLTWDHVLSGVTIGGATGAEEDELGDSDVNGHAGWHLST